MARGRFGIWARMAVLAAPALLVGGVALAQPGPSGGAGPGMGQGMGQGMMGERGQQGAQAGGMPCPHHPMMGHPMMMGHMMGHLMMTGHGMWHHGHHPHGGMGQWGQGGGWGMQGGGMRGPGIRLVDANGDGTVSADEAASMAEAMFDRMDDDGDDRISREEFLDLPDRPMMPDRMQAMQARREARFKAMDRNGDGFVDHDEWVAFHRDRHQAADLDRDGKVSPWEFRSAMRRR